MSWWALRAPLRYKCNASLSLSATLGEEPEAQVGPVWPLRAGNLLTESTKKQCSSKIGFSPAPG